MRGLILFGALALGACAGTPPPAEGGSAGAGPWQCDAGAAQSLVGSHRGAVLFPEDANVRFVCNECAMTQDYRSDRLTIYYDQNSGTITRVQCV